MPTMRSVQSTSRLDWVLISAVGLEIERLTGTLGGRKMKYCPPGREASETPSTPGRSAAARGGQRRLPAGCAAREVMERSREPPHLYQRLQGQQAL